MVCVAQVKSLRSDDPPGTPQARHPLRRRVDGLHLPRVHCNDVVDGPQFSARGLFLAECVDKDLQPRAGFLLRKMRSTEITKPGGLWARRRP